MDWRLWSNGRLRLRLRRELAEHRRQRRRALRREGASWWRARRLTRITLEERRRIYGACRSALGADPGGFGVVRMLRWPGVAPMLALALAGPLLMCGARAPLVRASLRGRLPYPPSNALLLISGRGAGRVSPGLGWAQFQRLQRERGASQVAAFRYDHVLWDGHHGQQAITVVSLTANLAAWLGVRTPPLLLADRFWRSQYRASPALVGKTIALDNRAVAVAGVLPADDWFLFRYAQAWVLLPPQGEPGRRVNVVGRVPLHGVTAVPLSQYFLDDLSFARWGWMGILGLWIALAGLDLARLAGQQGWRCLGRAAGYWAYAAATVASVGVLLLALCGYMVEFWPRAGAAPVLLTLIAYLLLCRVALRCCLEDQRYRCRTCLRRLRMPLAEGRMGGILLTAPAIEYLCPRGHGKLLVPARPCQPHPLERWSFARDWWQELRTSSGTTA